MQKKLSLSKQQYQMYDHGSLWIGRYIVYMHKRELLSEVQQHEDGNDHKLNGLGGIFFL